MDLTGDRVLIVEDELLIALDVQDTLTNAGALVVGIAATADEGLALIDTNHVTFAVLDVTLRGSTSQDVAERLSRQGIPFIFYTSNRMGAKTSGVDDRAGGSQTLFTR